MQLTICSPFLVIPIGLLFIFVSLAAELVANEEAVTTQLVVFARPQIVLRIYSSLSNMNGAVKGILCHLILHLTS